MKTIAIYPGNFQPPHKGHFMIYKRLRKMVGADVFIALTSGTPTEHAPLNFSDKELIWVRHGVPASHIIKVMDWKHPHEIFEKFSKTNTSAVFALNRKEIDELQPRKRKAGHVSEKTENSPDDPNKEIWVDNEGELSYFQPLEGNEGNMAQFENHAYVIEVDDAHIDGKPWSTANVRQALGSPRYTDEQKKKVFYKIFGWFDIGLYNILRHKFKMASQVASPDEETPVGGEPSPVVGAPVVTGRHKLREMVRACLKEILEGTLDHGGALGNDEEPGGMAASLDANKSDAEKRNDRTDSIDGLVQQKRNAEMEKKQHDSQGERDQISYLNYRKITQSADRDKIDALNKQIATTKSNPTI